MSPAPVATPPRGAQPRQQQRAQVPAVPFQRASQRKTMQAFSTGPTTLSAAQVNLGPINLPPAGYLRYIDLDVTITTAGNIAGVVFAADAPWSVIAFLTLENSAGDSLIVPINGYHLYLANKYCPAGLDAPWCDPRADPFFSVTPGAGATGGSASFRLRVPMEMDPADAFCALPNQASNRSYRLGLQLAPIGQVYTTAPTNAPTVSINAVAGYWSQPHPVNGAGVPQEIAPRGAGSVQMLRYQSIPVTAGDKLLGLTNVGNTIRTILFILRTAAGARTNADMPSIHQLIINNDTRFYLPHRYWQSELARAYGYTSPTFDAAGGLDTGVLVLHQLIENEGHVRADAKRSQWLTTLDTTLLQYRASALGGGASTLEVLTNEVKATSPQALFGARFD